MARKPQEKYKPGELTKVKKNLGTLSRNEAKRMSEILGGEIGIEKTDQNINDRYQEIFKNSKNKTEDRWIERSPQVNSSILKKENKSIINYTYIEKIKLYYLASHPDHGVKTMQQTIKAIFDLLSKQKNYINPGLLDSSNYFFSKSIKTLVKSTRIISKSIQKKYIRREEKPFFWLIADTICTWDIEGIQEEIFKLKHESRNVTIESWAPIVKLIYTPLIKLSKLNRKNDIEGTIIYLYKLSIKGLFKKDLQIDRLRKSYTLALSEINNVFIIIKFRLYPLLLMLVSPKVYDYNTLFRLKGQEIINFLDISTNDIITYFDSENTKNSSLFEETIQEDQQETEKLKIKNFRIQHGIILLNRMFPKAGWDHLSDNPDMYPYFKTILNIPKEISLISPNDPLQKIVILIAILKDMFYGFSNIEYGFFVNDMDKPVEVKDKIELLIKNWYLYIDELILKHYLGPLNEYCRHLERSTDVAETEYAKRIASNILWLKKTYICPNIPVHLPKIMQPRIKFSIPKLHKSVEQLKTILERMVMELYSQGEIAVETIRNPRDNPWFEIENHVSKRLISLLKKDNKKLTNRKLILFTYLIVEVLNSIIQNPDEEIDDSGISKLFRSEGSRGFKPIYSVNSNNTYFQSKDTILKTNLEEDTEFSDPFTGFFGKKQLTGYLQHYISVFKNTGIHFTILHINIYNFKSTPIDTSLKNTGEAISESIRFIQDIPFRTGADNFYIILSETDTSMAIKTGERIFSNKNNIHQVYIGICECKEGMGTEQIMTHLDNTISKQIPTPGITYYNAASGKYIQQSL